MRVTGSREGDTEEVQVSSLSKSTYNSIGVARVRRIMTRAPAFPLSRRVEISNHGGLANDIRTERHSGWLAYYDNQRKTIADDDNEVGSKRDLHLPLLLAGFQGISVFGSSSGLWSSSADSRVERRKDYVCELARIAQKCRRLEETEYRKPTQLLQYMEQDRIESSQNLFERRTEMTYLGNSPYGSHLCSDTEEGIRYRKGVLVLKEKSRTEEEFH